MNSITFRRLIFLYASVIITLFFSACAATKKFEGGKAPQTLKEVLPKIGVALGGGGARGFAQIGVLRVLEQEKIPIDVVVGTSVGSLIGAIYADSGKVLDAEFIAISITDEDIFDYRAFSFFSGGFVKGEKLESFLNNHLRNKNIENFKVRFGAVAVDLRTGRSVIFDRGPVARAVHASCAIPGVFVPVEIGGNVFVDGGVTDPIPVDFAQKMGAEVVIAVAIPPALPAVAPKNPIEIAFHAVTIMSSEIGVLGAKDADVVIRPDVGNVAYDDFSQKKKLIEAGEKAARDALPAIREAIKAKTKQVPVIEEKKTK
ncbi:MAG: patatin-like phospholipase family protein [Desulfobacterales bacterium]|nr:patatin-like phospholipase family protein [Desulfobacterales bacterium]